MYIIYSGELLSIQRIWHNDEEFWIKSQLHITSQSLQLQSMNLMVLYSFIIKVLMHWHTEFILPL
jgi:hypothetical protein